MAALGYPERGYEKRRPTPYKTYEIQALIGVPEFRVGHAVMVPDLGSFGGARNLTSLRKSKEGASIQAGISCELTLAPKVRFKSTTWISI